MQILLLYNSQYSSCVVDLRKYLRVQTSAQSRNGKVGSNGTI